MFKNILLVVLSVGVIVAAGFGYGLMNKEDTLRADVNGDGVTNLQDVSIVMSEMSTSTVISAPTE